MKKISAFIALLSLALTAGAEQLDYWEITKVDGQAYISDGDWKFLVSLRNFTMQDPATAAYIANTPLQLNVGSCTNWPSQVAALDFSKPLVNNTGDGKTYLISSVSPVFGTVSGTLQNAKGTAKESGGMVGALTLPTHTYRFEIGGAAFAGCTNLVYDLKNLPTSIVTINNSAFINSSVSGATLELPYVTRTYDNMFMNCPGITGFNAPNLTGANSTCPFANCTSLKSAALGDYTAIGNWFFLNCSAMESMTPFVGDACNSIGRAAFQNCASITNALVFKGSMTASNWEMFDGCSSVPSADLSECKLQELSRCNFNKCSSITVLKLPATLCKIAGNTAGIFSYMTSLKSIEAHASYNGFLNQFPSETTALSEVHFYNCSPADTNSVFKNISASQVVTTYLHDMTDEQLAAWAECTEGGELSTTSTWSSKLAGATAYANRPLVVYAEQHAQIAAGNNAVVVDGQLGSFTVSRGDGDPCSGDLVVNYTVGGDAIAGTHYVALSGSVTIPNGSSNATVSVTGCYIGTAFEKDLTITLGAGDYKIVEGKGSASISVIGGYRSVNVTKLEDANKQLGKIGSIRVSRGTGDSTANDLVVALGYTGTAINGTTYRELPTSVTIPAGSDYVDLKVYPLDDASVTADSEAVVTIGDGLYTTVGDPAVVTILYGNGKLGCWHIYDDNGVKKISDGVWTFKCTLQGTLVSTGDAYRMDIGAATEWPDEVSPLDFSKVFYDEYDGRTYKIGYWSMQFGSVSGYVATPSEAGDKVGLVKLLGGSHDSWLSDKTFAGCTNMILDLADLPTNIVTIGAYVFMGSSASGALDLPNLTSVGIESFYNCTGLTSVSAPKLKTIGERVFEKATSLKSVDLGPDETCVLTTIGQYAFDGCTALESFTPFLPSNMDKLNTRSAFMNCSSLTNALVFKGSNLGEDKGWSSCGIFSGCAKIPSVDLSMSTITALRRETLANCSSLEWVKLPATFAEFGIPDAPSDLCNRSPFGGTMSVKLYFSATNMPRVANLSIPLVTAMEFSDTLSNITNNAFDVYTSLKTITFNGAKPETVGADLFSKFKANTITCYVPYEYVASWQTLADDGVITSEAGTWTSGTTQQIRSYRLRSPGLVIFLR